MEKDIKPDSAQEIILGALAPLPSEELPLQECVGRVSALDVRAACDLPPFDNSAMDGYAVLAGSSSALKIVETVRAGQTPRFAVGRREAAKIMTGAPLPSGADAVVPREQARESAGSVEILEKPEAGQHVRGRGQDVRAGDVVLAAGSPIRPYEIALLASQGLARVRVARRPRVAVVASGDELVDFREAIGPGRIRNSNGPALAAMLSAWGYGAVDRGIVPDDPELLGRRFGEALDDCDALLISGGVSVGEFDHTRAVLEGLGFSPLLWRVKIKPGKPLLFGLWKGKPVFGLPGNPISSLVCCEVFVRPALERLEGRAAVPERFPLVGRLAKPFDKPAGLRQYLFCSARRKGASFALEVLEPQGSGLIGMGSRADALAVGPAGPARLESGMEVRFKWL